MEKILLRALHASSWLRRYASPPSSLPGSASLHLFKEDEAFYESLTRDIHANCDTLFTLPGMGSLNLWSDVPTPNGLNLTAWVKGFNSEQQGKILQILQSDTKACVVYNADLVGFWETTPRDLDALPLARYILYTMQKTTQNHGSYEIRIHPSRTSPWIEAQAPVARRPTS